MDLDEALQVVWEEASRRGQNGVARALDVSNATVSRWKGLTRPDGDVRARVIAFAEEVRASRPAPLPPVAVPGDFWRGVYYAAELMSETTARLLREAREGVMPSSSGQGPTANLDAPLVARDSKAKASELKSRARAQRKVAGD